MTALNGHNGNGALANAHEITTQEQLLKALEATKTAPLWAQMQRLNPPAPSPRTVPYLWAYDAIRPYLLRAGALITEKQAERRVLMLANPARGTSIAELRDASIRPRVRSMN